MIDEALAEIEELEADVLEMFTAILGTEATEQIQAYKRAQESAPRILPLRREASSGPSTTPPATR